MSEELKPCPFCGKQPERKIYGQAGYIVAKIECPKCGTCKTVSTGRGTTFFDVEVAMDKVKKVWNRRADE